METYKNRYQLCLFLFINNVDLKNDNRNYRKSFWIFSVSELLQQICLKSILINQDTLMKRHLPPLAPLLKGQRGKCPRHASILSRPCAYHSTHTLFTRCCRLQCVTV